MFRGGAAVAMPTSTPRPVGRLNLLYQPSGALQQTAGVGPSWRRAGRVPHQEPPPPPPPKTNCELKQKWTAGLSRRISQEVEETPKPESQNLPQWKRKQEQEKKPEESERKVEPLWKRVRETEKNKESEMKHEPEKKQNDEKLNDTETNMERKRPEPLWKKKREPGRLEIKAELKRRPEPICKKQEVTNNKLQDKKLDLPKIQECQKIEPVKKLEPLWKRKFEPVKKPEPEVKEAPVKKIEPIWKRKIEAQEKKESDTKQEPVKKQELRVPGKIEPIWKRKIEPEDKTEAKTKQEQTKKSVPLWKRKKEPEKEAEQKQENESKTNKEQGTEDLPEEDETEGILCPMCSELFDEDEFQPVLLPRCGHTFCRPCLTTIKGKGHFPCPTCRKRHLKPPIEDLPIHTEILNRANTYREERFSFFSKTMNHGCNARTGKCQTHQNLLMYWCRDCREPLCSSCRVMNNHDVVRMKVVLKEKRQEMKEKGQVILDNVLEEKKKIIDSVRTCSIQLLKVCEESATVDDSSKDVKVMLSDTKQTADLSFVLRGLERMKSILGVFGKARSTSSASSDSESDEDTTPKPRRRKDRRQSGDASSTENRKSPEKKVTLNPARNKRDLTTKQITDVTSNTKINKTPEMRVTHQQPAVGGMNGTVSTDVTTQGPLLSLSDGSLWPLTCCVYTDNGRRGRLSRKGGRLHMSALTENEEEAHFMIKLSVIRSVIPQDNPEVFLEMQVGERNLGRIYIKLWGHLRRAHHFLALCMGTHGPSYRGAKFEEVFSRGLKGECLHAGPYLTPSGDLSAQRVMDGLEWDGQFKKTQQKGLVVGAGSGRPDREACFDICTIENPARHFACPFGEVVDGWDTIAAILECRPVRAVTMVDVGVVLPNDALPVS